MKIMSGIKPGHSNDLQSESNLICSTNLCNLPLEQFVTKLNIKKLLSKCEKYELNHLSGSIINHILQIGCKDCCIFLNNNLSDNTLCDSIKIFSKMLNKGEFKVPCLNLLVLIIHNSCSELIKKIVIEFNITFLECC